MSNVCINVKMATFLTCFKYSKIPVIICPVCNGSRSYELCLFRLRPACHQLLPGPCKAVARGES